MVVGAKGFFSNLLSAFDRSKSQREALVELLLMSALADGVASTSELDRLAKAIETQEILRGIEWPWVEARLAEIRRDAPRFDATRARLQRTLKAPEIRRSGISLAAQFLGTPLAEADRALLERVATSFEIHPSEREELFAAWAEADPFQLGYVRTSFNDPDHAQTGTIFDAMADSENDVELGLLTYKLSAIRAAMNRLSDETELVTFGESLDLDDARFRVDAYLSASGKSWLARFLGRGEALYPKERELLPVIIARMDPSASLYVGYAETLSPPDEAVLKALDPERVLVEKLAV